MYEGYRVIDADGHFYEPRDIWDRYVEPEFYDRRPRVREIFGRSRMDFEVDGVFFHKSKITSATTKRYASQEEPSTGTPTAPGGAARAASTTWTNTVGTFRYACPPPATWGRRCLAPT